MGGGQTHADRSCSPTFRLAKEHGIDLETVLGTGKNGRIMKSDVLEMIRVVAEGGQAAAVAAAGGGGAATFAAAADSAPAAGGGVAAGVHVHVPREAAAAPADTVVPVGGISRLMVKSMDAANAVPHFGYCDEYNMDALVQLRKDLAPRFESKGMKLSYLPLLIKAASLALEKHPGLNAHVADDECTAVIQKGEHNIGLAMDTPRGLLVPVIHGVQAMSVADVAARLGELHQLGLQNKLGERELTGGTFTLSNIGAIGGTYAKPVLMVPQVAIGALGKMQTLPRFDEDGNVYAARLMNVSWAADHRVVDGATMARFSNLMKEYVECPTAMLSELS